ncbi:MAG: thioredoxin family protein [Peptostreptococcaceae bacterium]|nr:thioredoxin family protein [Peptostreptococcaceae bacterium]
MAFLNEDISKQIKAVFAPMKENVNIALFVDKTGCESCEDARGYMEEMASLSDKLSLSVYDVARDKEKAMEFDVKLTPAIVLLDSENKNNGVKFNGIPAGHEINSFISGILNVSGAGEKLPEEMMQRIKSIDKPVNIKVFVTLGCPHCPGAVSKAHKIALLNPNVNAEMIEANTFEELSQKFNVGGVPKIVFNDSVDLIGDQPLDAFINAMETL